MTKVYCCDFMEQIYLWFEQNENMLVLSVYLTKLSLKMIGWKEQEPEAELSVKHLKLSIAHYSKACCNLFWYGLKPALFNISHFSHSFNLVRHQDLKEKSLSFYVVPL